VQPRLTKCCWIVAMLMIAMGPRAADDPFLGAWKLNLAKSRYSPGPPPKSGSNTFELAPGGLKLIVRNTETQGKPTSFERIELYDGQIHPAHGEGRLGPDGVSLRRPDPYTIEIVNYKNGKVTSRTTRKVSKDGKTMTSSSKGTDADGHPLQEFRFFEKQ
jgi:hypothetical protein